MENLDLLILRSRCPSIYLEVTWERTRRQTASSLADFICNKPSFSIMDCQGFFCKGWGRSQSQNVLFWEQWEQLKSEIASRKKPGESQSKPVISLINFSSLKHKPDMYITHKDKCGLGLLCFVIFNLVNGYLQSLHDNGKYKVYVDEKQSAICCYYPKQSVQCTYWGWKSFIRNW